MDDGSDWEAFPRYGLSHQGIDSTWEYRQYMGMYSVLKEGRV